MKRILLPALLLIPLAVSVTSATDEAIAINHCAPGRNGLVCKELTLDAGSAAAHLKNHPNDSLVQPPDPCAGDNIVWGDCNPGDDGTIVWGT